MKNSYKESIDRLAFNFGLDCLDGKEDQSLAEDISNMTELLNEYEKLKIALNKACTLIDDITGSCPFDMFDCKVDCDNCTDCTCQCWVKWAMNGKSSFQ